MESSHRDWLVGGGEMGELIRATDWSSTPLGPRERWTPSLRTVVLLILASKLPMALLWGRELLFLYNDACRVVVASKHPRALGRSFREIWPEIWHSRGPVFAAVMDRGESVILEDQVFPIRRAGLPEDATFTLSCSPVCSEDGGVAGTFVTLLETTGRNRAEKAAAVRAEAAQRESLELLRLTLRGASAATSTWNVVTGEITWGPEAYDLFGLPVEEGVDFARWEQRVHPDDRPALNAAARDLREGRSEEYRGEYRILHPQRGDRWISVLARADRGEDGAVLRTRTFSMDVTERRRVERELLESQHFFQNAMEVVPGMLRVFDLVEMRTVYINRQVTDTLGYQPRDVIALGSDLLPSLMHPEDIERFEQRLPRIRALNDGETSDLEYRMRTARGGMALVPRSRCGVPPRRERRGEPDHRRGARHHGPQAHDPGAAGE